MIKRVLNGFMLLCILLCVVSIVLAGCGGNSTDYSAGEEVDYSQPQSGEAIGTVEYLNGSIASVKVGKSTFYSEGYYGAQSPIPDLKVGERVIVRFNDKSDNYIVRRVP